MIHTTYRFNITITNEKKSKKTTRRRRFAGAWHVPARLLPASCTRLLRPCAEHMPSPALPLLPLRLAALGGGGSSPACPGARSSPPARGPRPRLAARQPPPAPGRELRDLARALRDGADGERDPGGRSKLVAVRR